MGEYHYIIPVLPSADIARDVVWYRVKTGFDVVFQDAMYAVLGRENLGLHLQRHADTPDDPLLGGSVIRIAVNGIRNIFEEFVERGTVDRHAFREKTAWNTAEFGFFDLNRNAIFIAENL